MQKATERHLSEVGSVSSRWQAAPSDIEAEQRLIGSILNDNAAISRLPEALAPEDFYDPLHAEIFRQATLISGSGKKVTTGILCALFEDAEAIKQGLTVPDYIKSLATSGASVEAALADAHSVLEVAAARKRMMGPALQPPRAVTNRTKQTRISLVTPLYKSARYIEELYERAVSTIRKLTPDYEIIFVNDGSPEEDLRIAKSIADRDPRVLVIDLSRNFGQHPATLTGLRHATGDYVFVCDSDLEENPEWLFDFFSKLQEEEADVVYGVMTNKNKSVAYRCLRRIYYGLMRGVSGIDFPTNVVPARIMSRRYLDALLSFQEHEVFLLGLWQAPGFRQVPHDVIKKSTSSSTYTFGKLASLFVHGILSFSIRPLGAVAVAGLVTSLAAFVLAGLLIIKSLFFGQSIPGWASIVTAMLLVGGLTISLNGVIALYIGKIFLEVKRRPISIVREVYQGQADATADWRFTRTRGEPHREFNDAKPIEVSMWAPCGPSGGAVPEPSGKLCRLRPLTKSDAAVTLAWRQDAETRELVMGYRLPVTEASEAAWYEQVIDDRSGKRASFAIEAQSGKLVGIVHLMEIDAFSQSAKFGIVIGDKSERRKGFGAEATMLLLRYAFGTLNLHRIELQVLASNTAAVRLYEALGFITEGRSREAHFLHGRFVDVLVMGLLRHEFKDIPAADPRYRY